MCRHCSISAVAVTLPPADKLQERKAGTSDLQDGSKGLIDVNPPRGRPVQRVASKRIACVAVQ